MKIQRSIKLIALILTIFVFPVLGQHPELEFIYDNYNSKIEDFITQYSATTDSKSALDILKKLFDLKLNFFDVEKKLMDQYEFDMEGLIKNPPNSLKPVILKKIALEQQIIDINEKNSKRFSLDADFLNSLDKYTQMHQKKTEELKTVEEAGNEMVLKLKQQLLINFDKIIELNPNRDIQKPLMEPVKFTMKKFGEYASYDAVKFKVPAQGGKLLWAFSKTRQIEKWYIMAKDYTMKKGFKIFSYTSKYFLQELESWNLVPNTYYIIWFQFNKIEDIKIDISLNIVPDSSSSVRDLVDFLKKNNEYD